MAYLEMRHITKRFGAFVANDDVNLTVESGEIHALLGENGAGKSTLMNVLYGMYDGYEGQIFLDGKPVRMQNPKQAMSLGIGMVHQHFMLIPPLSAVENVVLGLQGQGVVLNLKEAAAKLSAIAEEYGMSLNPWEKVDRLSVGQQQRLEIIKALYRGAKLLILDEPTAVLTPQETASLFYMIRKMTEKGMTIIFITHKLTEIMELCDRCTVLRRGKVVSSVRIEEINDKTELAKMMVGKDVTLTLDKPEHTVGETVLSVNKLCYVDEKRTERLKSISFDIHEGEILGVCGVDGNGQSELIKCITGLCHISSGSVQIMGRECSQASVRDILDMGVAHIPEDRLRMAAASEMSILENMLLMSVRDPQFQKNGILKWDVIRQYNEKLCEEFDVRYSDLNHAFRSLSGGNQQKVVVARELSRNPKLLIAVHPARGLDINATKFIQSQILDERKRNTAVLLVSTELDEIMELSDRIIVMFEGHIVGSVSHKEATRELLGKMMAGIVL